MGERGMQIRRDVNQATGEAGELMPTLCEACLGPNPYVRMVRKPHGSQCQICSTSMDLLLWKPAGARNKRTVLCQSCATVRGACQCCVKDLVYGLPLALRDAVVAQANKSAGGQGALEPQSQANRDYAIQLRAQQVANGGGQADPSAAANEALLRLARKRPNYEGGRICSFWSQTGQCVKGDKCTYRHDPVPGDEETGDSRSAKSARTGAASRFSAAATQSQVQSTAGTGTGTTLFLGGADERVTEAGVRDALAMYGDLAAVRLVPRQSCAFAEFGDRAAAEWAYNALVATGLDVGGTSLRVAWAKSSSSSSSSSSSRSGPASVPQPAAPAVGGGAPPPPPGAPGAAPISYPSMNPQ